MPMSSRPAKAVGSAFAALNPPMSSEAGRVEIVEPAIAHESPPPGSAFAKVNPPVNPAKVFETSSNGKAVTA